MHVDVDETRLDDPAALADADPAGMLRAVASSGAQVRRAVVAAQEAGVARLAEDGRPRAVAVAGVGVNGVAGEVLAAVAGSGCPVPIVTCRGYRLPGWVGPMDLVVVASEEGAGEETLGCAEQAVQRGCRMLVVTAAGSPLADLAERGRGVLVPTEAGDWAVAPPAAAAPETAAVESAAVE
ncbi:MAG: mannose-6-phosphate isomerase, partial [Actinomycetes bacterium]